MKWLELYYRQQIPKEEYYKQAEDNTYHSWIKKWHKDMKKHYSDKRRIIVRKYK